MIKKNMEDRITQYLRLTGDDPIITVQTKGFICYCFICRLRNWMH